jgi:hypothetical protein
MDIVEKSALIVAPATIVVGDVVSLADKLEWFIPQSEQQARYGSEHSRESART